jgi:hypothetical protein
MSNSQIISIIVVVVVVIIILAIVVMLMRRRITKPIIESGQESDSRISVSAPRGESRYRVTKGKLMEDESQVKAEQPKIEVQAAAEQEFPRNLAMAGNKMNDYLPKNSGQEEKPDRIKVEAKYNDDQNEDVEEEDQQQSDEEEQQVEFKNRTQPQHDYDTSRRTVTVSRLADLFSPKENIEEELGVDAAELDKLVTAYKKKTEYKERRLPVNAHFNIEDYKESKNVMRESAVNANAARGSKRGQITAQIYKKHGKNFTVQKPEVTGGNMSIDNDGEDNHTPAVKLPRNNGKLVVH